jgi:cysteine desulfuration protein SufE
MAEDSIQERTREIVVEFEALDDWVDRYRYLVELGDKMTPLPQSERTDDTRLPGCQYGLWIRTDYDADRDALRFLVHSDAKITRGLAALIVRVLDGQPPAVVAEAELEFLDQVGLRTHLSSQRNSGLSAMIHEMKSRARQQLGADLDPNLMTR